MRQLPRRAAQTQPSQRAHDTESHYDLFDAKAVVETRSSFRSQRFLLLCTHSCTCCVRSPKCSFSCPTPSADGPSISPFSAASLSRFSHKRAADDRLQLAPLRDPRAAAVSNYFYAREKSARLHTTENVDEGVLEGLPSVAQWIALRHILFQGLLANSSEIFWYEDATEDPLDWHFRFTELAGLRLPVPWIKNMTSLRLEGHWVDRTTGLNPHPGGHEASETRTWRDEVSPDIIPEMNAIVRTWLPPVFLARLGIPP